MARSGGISQLPKFILGDTYRSYLGDSPKSVRLTEVTCPRTDCGETFVVPRKSWEAASEMRRVLIFGARDWTDSNAVQKIIDQLVVEYGTNGLIIIHGGAPGADALASQAAAHANVHSAQVNALWSTRHRGAGPQRNQAMLGLQPHEAYGFHHDIGSSRGSADMQRRCMKVGIPVRIIS